MTTLLPRLTVINTLAAALVFWAHQQGLVAPIFINDVSYLSYAAVALFAFGIASTFWRAGNLPTTTTERRVRLLHDKNAHITDIAAWLQVLGLLGTVIGFAVALDGHAADDPDAIITGLRTAIGTTVLGGFLSLWTAVNFRMLDTATAACERDK